ncbi:2'-5' RNA ligase [Lipingzhangella halophila]|uniref:2'-5' RNA ligase n=1 Tax=Lipingzhangella halophila TaxID=1783352 RepID=A0A7W7W350_9ACTN|nr:2'-5' RNA ligase family protein [Lipingzhangella halophila]MBB4931380.1 2'-5' RNA ligase [Lipingzhangella halophila]
MSPLPTHMRDRWQDRAEPAPGQSTVYWHVLLGDDSQVRAAAAWAQEQLAGISGLHLTPLRWLHATTLVAGPTEEISEAHREAMVAEVRRELAHVSPVPVTLERVLWHPEAIMLGVEPQRALDPVQEAARRATRVATGRDQVNEAQPVWTPHVTIAYSTTGQPAEPIIAVLGRRVPRHEVTVDALSLVVQWGPEREWSWEVVATVKLGMGVNASGP